MVEFVGRIKGDDGGKIVVGADGVRDERGGVEVVLGIWGRGNDGGSGAGRNGVWLGLCGSGVLALLIEMAHGGGAGFGEMLLDIGGGKAGPSSKVPVLDGGDERGRNRAEAGGMEEGGEIVDGGGFKQSVGGCLYHEMGRGFDG